VAAILKKLVYATDLEPVCNGPRFYALAFAAAFASFGAP
jgi:hypothetical protein